MAGPNYVLDKGFVAGGAVERFRFVELNAAGTSVTQSNAAGESSIGVVQETASAGDATNGRVVDVRLMGISRCIAGATLATAGVAVTTDNQGRVAAAAVGNQVLGILLTPAANAGDHVDVLLTQSGVL